MQASYEAYSPEMESFHDVFDSSSSISSLDSESNPVADSVSFFSKISEELKTLFRRNSGNDDYCDYIYEDMYATPSSGRFSYYTDLLAMAHSKDGGKNKFSTKKLPEKTETIISTTSPPKSYCSWPCSGYHDPSLGSGPLEDLFSVLDSSYPNFSLPIMPNTASANISTCWQENPGAFCSEMFSNSLEDGYSDFVDIFHRWSSDIFPLEFSSSDPMNI